MFSFQIFVGRRRELVANSIHTADATRQLSRVGVGAMSQTLRVYLYSFSHCCRSRSRITRNSDKISLYSSSWSSKVIDLGVNRKMWLPI